MHKLVILIHSLTDWSTFDKNWPEFLHLVESMPGIRREATSRVEEVLLGERPVTIMHELFFDDLEQTKVALASPQGRAAGKLLQRITSGRVELFLADHKEDDVENLRKSSPGIEEDD